MFSYIVFCLIDYCKRKEQENVDDLYWKVLKC